MRTLVAIEHGDGRLAVPRMEADYGHDSCTRSRGTIHIQTAVKVEGRGRQPSHKTR